MSASVNLGESVTSGRPDLASRAVSRIANPKFEQGNVPDHTARRLIDGDVAFSDPFVLMAEDWMPRGAFPLHPHRGFETVTFVIDGALEHHDSAGHGGQLNAGDAQWMTAGRGVSHTEEALPGVIAHTLQLWVNLAAADKLTEPSYQDLRGDSVPVRLEPGVEIRVFSGSSGNVASPTLNHVEVTALDARIEAGASFTQILAPDFNAFVLVLEGTATVGASETLVEMGAIAWLTKDDGGAETTVELGAMNGPVRLLLFAGRPLREPVAFGGPFVMNTKAEIDQAFADHRAGLF